MKNTDIEPKPNFGHLVAALEQKVKESKLYDLPNTKGDVNDETNNHANTQLRV